MSNNKTNKRLMIDYKIPSNNSLINIGLHLGIGFILAPLVVSILCGVAVVAIGIIVR